jgi:hypothetical protein
MKLFSASLHGEARRWYDNLPAASITSMEQFEKVFLAKWTMEEEDMQSLLKELEDVKQAESEIVRDYCARFRKSLYQIPQGYRPEDKYLVYLYTNGLQVHLSFLLNKKKPKTLAEAHKMAMQIERSLFMTKTDAVDTLSLIKLVSHEILLKICKREGEQVLDQQNEDVMRSKNLNKMMKYPPVLLPLMKSCRNLSLLCSKAKMRLVIFHFKILIILCYLIQKKKRKWKPRMKWKQSMRMKKQHMLKTPESSKYLHKKKQ